MLESLIPMGTMADAARGGNNPLQVALHGLLRRARTSVFRLRGGRFSDARAARQACGHPAGASDNGYAS